MLKSYKRKRPEYPKLMLMAREMKKLEGAILINKTVCFWVRLKIEMNDGTGRDYTFKSWQEVLVFLLKRNQR